MKLNLQENNFDLYISVFTPNWNKLQIGTNQQITLTLFHYQLLELPKLLEHFLF